VREIVHGDLGHGPREQRIEPPSDLGAQARMREWGKPG